MQACRGGEQDFVLVLECVQSTECTVDTAAAATATAAATTAAGAAAAKTENGYESS